MVMFIQVIYGQSVHQLTIVLRVRELKPHHLPWRAARQSSSNIFTNFIISIIDYSIAELPNLAQSYPFM